VIAIEVYIVLEKVVLSSEMVESHSEVVSSDVVVEILGICSTVMNCAREEVSSELKVVSSDDTKWEVIV
jgi:hypothetical protein